MENKKLNVWILSHDSWLDHRLYFFYDAFQKLGAKCTMFAESVDFGAPLHIDYRPVIRAERSILRTQLSNAPPDVLDRLIDSRAFAANEAVEFIERIQRFQLRRKNSDLQRLQDSGQNLDFKWRIDDGDLVCKMRSARGSFTLSYESLSDILKYTLPIERLSDDVHRPYIADPSLIAFDSSIYDPSNIYLAIENFVSENPGSTPSLIYVADLPTAPLAMHYGRKFGAKVILDCHEWWKEQYAIWGNGNSQLEQFIDHAERTIYCTADLHLTVGKFLAEDMSNHFQKPFEVIYTTNFMGEASKQEDRRTFWKRYIPDYRDEKILLFQGNLTTQRNLHIIPEIAKFLPDDVLFVVAGDGGYARDLDRLVGRHGVSNKVRRLGWFNQKTLGEITSHADLGFVPYVALSRYYSFGAPNKVFEYIASSLPFVFDPSMIEISHLAEKFKIGKPLNLANPEDAAKRIAALIQSDELMKDLRNGFQYARSDMSAAKQEERFVNLLRERGFV